MCKAISRAVAFALLTAGALGCVPSLSDNPAREPHRTLPSTYGASVPSPQVRSSAQKRWGDLLASPELRALIELALRNNRELNVRVQEMIIARAEFMAARGEVGPRAEARASVGLEKVGRHTSQGRADEANGVPEHLGDFAFGLTGSWEVDIWKKLRNAVKAADLRYLASVEARNFVITQIVAELARSYYELVAIDNQLDILHRNIDIQTNALEVVRAQKEAARVTELAVQRFEAEVLKNKGLLYDLEQERVQVENRINFLVGRYPQPVRRNPAELMEPLPNIAQTGLPSELLENRPDVRQAELELMAAKLDVKVVKASFYPSLSIEAGVGYESFNATHLLDTPGSLAYGVAAGLTAPLINRAAIEAQYRAANARQIQAVLRYEATLLQAYTDVANQLASLDNLGRSYALQEQQVQVLAKSVEVSKVLFQSTRADYMEVLMIRRDSLEAEMELVETRKRQLEALVSVYQALGGGWRISTPRS